MTQNLSSDVYAREFNNVLLLLASTSSRYVALCQKLSLQERTEELEAECVGRQKRNLKPALSLHQLQQDTKRMQLKVQTIYTEAMKIVALYLIPCGTVGQSYS